MWNFPTVFRRPPPASLEGLIQFTKINSSNMPRLLQGMITIFMGCMLLSTTKYTQTLANEWASHHQLIINRLRNHCLNIINPLPTIRQKPYTINQ